MGTKCLISKLRFYGALVLKGIPSEQTSYRTSISLRSGPGEEYSQPAQAEQMLVFYRDGKVYRVLSLMSPPKRGEKAAYTGAFPVPVVPGDVF